MKKLLMISALVTILLVPARPGPTAQQKSPELSNMTTYYVVLLRKGPTWSPQVTPESQRLQEEHLANIRKMAEAGSLVLAGPFTDNGDLRGMFVLQVGSLEEAKALAETDPAVKAGRLSVETHPWFSAKGIRSDRTPAPR